MQPGILWLFDRAVNGAIMQVDRAVVCRKDILTWAPWVTSTRPKVLLSIWIKGLGTAEAWGSCRKTLQVSRSVPAANFPPSPSEQLWQRIWRVLKFLDFVPSTQSLNIQAVVQRKINSPNSFIYSSLSYDEPAKGNLSGKLATLEVVCPPCVLYIGCTLHVHWHRFSQGAWLAHAS